MLSLLVLSNLWTNSICDDRKICSAFAICSWSIECFRCVQENQEILRPILKATAKKPYCKRRSVVREHAPRGRRPSSYLGDAKKSNEVETHRSFLMYKIAAERRKFCMVSCMFVVGWNALINRSLAVTCMWCVCGVGVRAPANSIIARHVAGCSGSWTVPAFWTSIPAGSLIVRWCRPYRSSVRSRPVRSGTRDAICRCANRPGISSICPDCTCSRISGTGTCDATNRWRSTANRTAICPSDATGGRSACRRPSRNWCFLLN